MRVQFREFKSMTMVWQQLFKAAADWATQVGPDRLINISHSCDHSEGVVTVWFWDELEAAQVTADQDPGSR